MAVFMVPGELKKPNSETKESRIDILERIVNNRIPVIDKNNKEVILKKDKVNLDAIKNFRTVGKKFDLITANGKIINTSDIKKSAIFGGGGAGKGGGTIQTAQAESLQCLYCAAMVREGANKPREHYTPSVIKKHATHAHLGGTTVDAALNLDDTWHYSAYHSALIMMKGNFINRNHGFHRDDRVMKAIYAAKKQAFVNSDMTVLSDDKWNPGDIWAVDKSIASVITKALNTESVTTLNADIVRLWKERKVVGISLKKIVSAQRARGSIMNEVVNLDKHAYSGGVLMAERLSTATFFRSKGGVIQADRNTIKVELRTPTYLGPLNAEITLATARGGRAGLGQIQDGAKKHLGKKFPDNNTLKTKAQSIENGNERDIAEFWAMVPKVAPKVTKEEFYKEISEQDVNRIHSKLGATTLVFMLANSTQKASDGFVSYIINYAGSKLEESSVYLKVYE